MPLISFGDGEVDDTEEDPGEADVASDDDDGGEVVFSIGVDSIFCALVTSALALAACLVGFSNSIVSPKSLPLIK